MGGPGEQSRLRACLAAPPGAVARLAAPRRIRSESSSTTSGRAAAAQCVADAAGRPTRRRMARHRAARARPARRRAIPMRSRQESRAGSGAAPPASATAPSTSGRAGGLPGGELGLHLGRAWRDPAGAAARCPATSERITSPSVASTPIASPTMDEAGDLGQDEGQEEQGNGDSHGRSCRIPIWERHVADRKG